MASIFLTTILSCNQVLAIANRVQQALNISHQQRYEVLLELKKVVPTCPVIVTPENEKSPK